jgi:hypothetical protein
MQKKTLIIAACALAVLGVGYVVYKKNKTASPALPGSSAGQSAAPVSGAASAAPSSKADSIAVIKKSMKITDDSDALLQKVALMSDQEAADMAQISSMYAQGLDPKTYSEQAASALKNLQTKYKVWI